MHLNKTTVAAMLPKQLNLRKIQIEPITDEMQRLLDIKEAVKTTKVRIFKDGANTDVVNLTYTNQVKPINLEV